MRFYLVLLSLGIPRGLLKNGAPCCRPGLEAGHPECQANFTPPPAGACLRVYMCVCIRTYVYKQNIEYTLAFRCMCVYIYHGASVAQRCTALLWGRFACLGGPNATQSATEAKAKHTYMHEYAFGCMQHLVLEHPEVLWICVFT